MLHVLHLNFNNPIHIEFAKKVVKQHFKFCKLGPEAYMLFEAVGFKQIKGVERETDYGVGMLINGTWYCKFARPENSESPFIVYGKLLSFLQNGNWLSFPQELKHTI